MHTIRRHSVDGIREICSTRYSKAAMKRNGVLEAMLIEQCHVCCFEFDLWNTHY
jgi:hypothetical protein